MNYLQDKQYYIDRYDLFTIKDCLEVIDVTTKAYVESLKKVQTDGLSKGELAKTSNWMANQHLYKVKAERYRAKEETIQKWMFDDKIKQDRYDSTPPPHNIRCSDCKELMFVRTKDLETFEEPSKMAFLFECPKCKKRKWIYENGLEREYPPSLCPKCKKEVTLSVVRKGKDKVVWKTTCSSCGFTKTTVDDFKKSRLERQKQEEQGKKMLETYREQFCSDEVGKKALEYIDSFPVAEEAYKEELKKYDSLAYQLVVNIKKLSVLELEKYLNKLLEKEKYIKLSLNPPEIGQNVIVTFNTQDSEPSRGPEFSVSWLERAIKKGLEGTNWRLMTDSISYRLGFLSGRLKGYEKEADFYELSGQKKEEKSKISDEDMMRYAGYHTIKLARLAGQHQGIENTRKRRLKHEPEGFFLSENEGPYECGICSEMHPGDEIWWNLDGLRCADCWRNITEGVIPSLKYGDRGTIYLEDWDLKSDLGFGLKHSTIRKLMKESLLHGRDLKRKDGTVYCTIYLIEENKEFLQKYKRKERKGMVITDLLGDKVEL